MKKYIFGAVLSLGILASPALTHAAGLTVSQIQAILNILTAFGADQSVINNVSTALNGGTHQQSSTQSTTQTQSTNQSTQSTQQQSEGVQACFGKLYATPGNTTVPGYSLLRNTDTALSINNTSDGGYILGGLTNLRDKSESSDSSHLLLLNLDANGKTNWQKIFHGSSGIGLESSLGKASSRAVSVPDGGYFAATNISNTIFDNGNPPLIISGLGADLLLVKTDASGVVQWQKSYGRNSNNNYQHPLSLQRVSGGYIVAGQTWKDNPYNGKDSFFSTFVLKADDQGNIIWQKRIGTEEGARFASFAQTPDGGSLLSFTSQMWLNGGASWGVGGIVIVKLDSSGNIQWQKPYVNIDSALMGNIVISSTADGGAIVAEDALSMKGAATDPTARLTEIQLLKLDASGSPQWSKLYGTATGYEQPDAIKQTPDGGYVVLGDNRDDVLLFKLNGGGDIVWQKAYSGGQARYNTGNEIPTDFIMTPDGGYAIVGTTDRPVNPKEQFSGDSKEILALKVDASGNIGFSESGWSAKKPNLDAYTASLPVLASRGGVGIVDSFDLSISDSSKKVKASDVDIIEKDLSQSCVDGVQQPNTIRLLATKDGVAWDSPAFMISGTLPDGTSGSWSENPPQDTDQAAGTFTVTGVTPPAGVTLQNVNGNSLPYSQTLPAGGAITFTFNFVTASSSSLPDLIISAGPSLNSGTLVAGQTLTFKATVKNQGNATASGTFNNRFRIDLNNNGGIDVDDPDIQALNSASNLAAGASQQVVSPGWTAVAGTYRLYACADRPGNLIAESDDVNNCTWGDTITIGNVLGASSDATNSQSANNFTYVWNRDLQIGSPYLDDVTALQKALTLNGEYTGEITGGFYNQTYAAVKAFQEKYGINTTGYVGPLTRAELNTLFAR